MMRVATFHRRKRPNKSETEILDLVPSKKEACFLRSCTNQDTRRNLQNVIELQMSGKESEKTEQRRCGAQLSENRVHVAMFDCRFQA